MRRHHRAINHHAPSLSTHPHAASASAPRFADAMTRPVHLKLWLAKNHITWHFRELSTKATTEGDPLHFRGRAMDTQNVQEEEAESDTVTYLRRGMISILDVIAVKLPDVFTEEILPKLDIKDTLNLAQVNKAYNAAVWSADGVRSLEAKITAHLVVVGKKIWTALPLYWAAKHGNVPAARALLASGEDVNKSVKDATVLQFAVKQGQVAVVKALIEAGADVNKTAGDNRTALIIAATQGQASCVVELIKAGADVNLASNDGDTPLVEAVKKGHDVIVGMLLLAGADVGKAVNHGRAMIATVNTKAPEHENIVKVLEQFGP